MSAMIYQPIDRGPLDEDFWRNLAALGQFAQRPRCRFTIGSELRPADENPLFVDRASIGIPAQRRPPAAEAIASRRDERNAARRKARGR